LDAIAPVCAGDSIAVYALRGHTLSRLVRPLAAGATFRLPDPIATGADRLGPVGLGHANGPLAWRSPTVLLDENVGDEWWVAWLDEDPDGGVRVHRGSALVQPGGEGIGTIIPIARRGSAVEVLATIARSGANPQLVRATVPTDSDELLRFTHDPPSLGEGEIKAWEASTRTAVAFAVTEDGAGVLRILGVDDTPDEGAHARGEVRLARSHVIVTPTGLPLPNGEALFAYSEFDVVQRGHGACLALDQTLCVQPGPVRILRIDAANTIRTTDLAPAGLVDSIAIERDQTVLAFFVDAVGETRAQHAMRFDAATGEIRRAPLEPSDEIPPLDRPALVHCGDEVWLAAEVVVEPGDAGRTNETAVMIVPASCVVR
jgi:hypothetical protein